MTRTYAAKRLLEHGPLTWWEFLEITGWPYKTASRVWHWLRETKQIRFTNIDGKRAMELA